MTPARTLTLDVDRKISYSIGGLFLTFGGLEKLIYDWVLALSNNSMAEKDKAIDMPLGKRIDNINKLLNESNCPTCIKEN